MKFFSTLAAIGLAIGSSMATAQPITLLLEAEALVAQPESGGAWTAQALDGASGGQVLFASARVRENPPPASLTIPMAGRYRVWVRYHRDKPTSPGFFILIRDEEGEEIASHFCDWSPAMPTETPWAPHRTWAGDAVGFIWEPFDVTFERPMRGSTEFGLYSTGAARQGMGVTDRQIDCVLFTTDRELDPATLDTAALETLASTPTPAVVEPAAPEGYTWATGTPAHVNDFAGVPASARRFQAGLINNGSHYYDDARLVRLGFNHDHAKPTERSVRHGIITQGHIESYRVTDAALAEQYPEPEGRFVNAQGTISKTFSFNFEPAAERAEELLTAKLQTYLDNPLSGAIGAWRTSVEDGGFFDYSAVSVAAFRQWLADKHGDIQTLNRRWGTSYNDFDQIAPPATFEEDPAAWLEHRDFCGWSYTQAVARQMPIIAKLDPKGRPRVGATSNLDLLAPYFSVFRPIDFDQLLSVAYANEPFVSWDTYCSDDQLACETEMMFSFSDGRKPVIQEWSNHAVDARLAARSYWSMVSKGVAGIFLFMFQEGRGHATYPKWALLSHDGSPKPKLAAYSNAAQEVHRLEPLITQGAYTYAVKPVALYWSRIDLSLARPHESLYGTTQNSPLHVYRTLRSLGYPVRWITPRQVRAGELNDVSAVVLVGVRYMPADVAGNIEAWVKAGGVIIGDELPAARDEYAQPQDTLAPIFGVQIVQPKQPAQGDTQMAVQESTQGYGEVTDAAVVRREPYTMVEEVAQQPGATHPVAVAVGDFMLSGIAPNRMNCIAGHVVGMTHRGHAGLVVNAYGEGKALYSAMMLGTIYESGGTGYEWDTGHSGLAFHRVLDAFLSFAGVRKGATADGVTPAVAAKLRIEAPIVTPDGNVMIGLTSFNDAPVVGARVRVTLPEQARGPFTGVYATVGGSRELHPLDARVDGDQLVTTLPTFDTHAAIVALRESQPLLGLKLPGLSRKSGPTAGLAVIEVGQRFDVEVTVHNPSSRPLTAGEVSLTLPAGWMQSAHAQPTQAIPPGGSTTVTFAVRAPGLAGATRLRPLLARFRNADTQSTPATEMVWWGLRR